MNGMLKKILVFIMLAVTTFFGLISDVVAVEQTLTISSVVELGQKNAGAFPGLAVRKRMTNDNKYVYCLDSNKSGLYVGYKMTLDKEIDDAGVIYIAMNGFPTKSMTGDDNKDYYITQFVIWLYYQEIHGIRYSSLDGYTSGKYDDYEIAPHIKKLYEGAVAAYKKGIVKPSMTVNSKNELTLTSDGKYLESGYNTVNLTSASTYSVSINNNNVGAYTVNGSGKKQTTFKSNEKFKVVIPTDNIKNDKVDIEISIDSEAIVNHVYRYKHSSANRQRVMHMGITNTIEKLNALIKFNYEIKRSDVEISKQDITTKEELPGATLVVKDINGKVIDTWVSTNEPHYLKLIPGKYILTETIAPDGYKLSTETIEFEVKNDGSVTKVVMYNQLKDKTVIKISKQDITTKEELPGATLVVKDSTGKIIDTWVSTNEPHLMENLAVGKYTLTETIAPEGYELSTETIEFEVKNDGSIQTVVMNNKLKNKTIIKISKQDITTKEELPGATLVVKDSTGKIIDTWVSTNEPHLMENLAVGKYTLTETIAPEGYELSTETIEFEVKNDGSVKTVVMNNKLKNKTIIKISKQDITTKEELPGATLVVKDSTGKIIDTWVSTNEPHLMENLEVGKYTLTETIAPEEYELSTETIEFEVKNDGSIQTVVMENTPKGKTVVKISKQDITTKEELPGATLVVKDIDGKVIDTWVSTNEPHLMENLAVGKYTLTETIAPEGYELSTATIEFEVKNDGSIQTIVMFNAPSIEVPKTSLNASSLVIVFGTIISLLGMGLVFKNVTKE